MSKDRYIILSRVQVGVDSLTTTNEPPYSQVLDANEFVSMTKAKDWILLNGDVRMVYKIQNKIKKKKEDSQKWLFSKKENQWKISTFKWGPIQKHYVNCDCGCVITKQYSVDDINNLKQTNKKQKENQFMIRSVK